MKKHRVRVPIEWAVEFEIDAEGPIHAWEMISNALVNKEIAFTAAIDITFAPRFTGIGFTDSPMTFDTDCITARPVKDVQTEAGDG